MPPTPAPGLPGNTVGYRLRVTEGAPRWPGGGWDPLGWWSPESWRFGPELGSPHRVRWSSRTSLADLIQQKGQSEHPLVFSPVIIWFLARSNFCCHTIDQCIN